MADEKCWASEEMLVRMRLASARYYNCRVFTRQFFMGEMVVRQNESAHQDKIKKLSPKCERSYKYVIIAHPNPYVLDDMQGKRLKTTFNAKHLKKLYA